MQLQISKFQLVIIILLFGNYLDAQVFKVEALNNAINSDQYDEISPVISRDGKTLYFTRVGYPIFDRTLKIKGENIAEKLDKNKYRSELAKIFNEISGEKVVYPAKSPFNQDIWVAKKIFNDFEKISHPSYPLNNALPNSVSALTPNGNELVVINRFSQYGGLQKGFSISRKKSNNEWTFPEPIEIDDYYNITSDVNLAMSADGNVLILSMEGSDSYGNNDLYICHKLGVNHWSKPKNLGFKVNTPARETTPYISADGKKIFFSSNRKGSLGGNDIFYIVKQGEGWDKWSEPFRFVEPINSDADDSQPYFNSATGYLYFASNREGSMDIYRAELMPPNPIHVTIKGRIINSGSGKLIPGKVLFAIEGQEHLESAYISDDGTFELTVLKGNTFRLVAEKSGFTSKNEEIVTFRSDYVYYKPHQVDLYLNPMELNAKVELKPIFFEQSKSVVLEKSYASLDELADFLKENWTVSIRIEGHTDNQGNKKALQKLSEERANAIKEYLVFKKFIQPLRIETVGLGDQVPLNGNVSEGLRAKNRRVEVVITKINNQGGELETRK